MVPVREVGKQLLHVDVWHVVVLSELLSKEGLARAGRSSHEHFDGLEASLLLELLLDYLDVLSKTFLAVPLQLNQVLGLLGLSLFAFFTFGWGLLLGLGGSNEQRAWLDLEV